MDGQGKIWVGLRGDVGYLEPDATGTMKYVSLIDKIPPENRDFLDVHRIAFAPIGVFFQSYAKILRWDGKRMQAWPSNGHNFSAVAEVDGRVYAVQIGLAWRRSSGTNFDPSPEARSRAMPRG